MKLSKLKSHWRGTAWCLQLKQVDFPRKQIKQLPLPENNAYDGL